MLFIILLKKICISNLSKEESYKQSRCKCEVESN